VATALEHNDDGSDVDEAGPLGDTARGGNTNHNSTSSSGGGGLGAVCEGGAGSGVRVPAHAIILAARSPFFAALLGARARWRETAVVAEVAAAAAAAAAGAGEVDCGPAPRVLVPLVAYPAAVVRALLRFVYTDDPDLFRDCRMPPALTRDPHTLHPNTRSYTHTHTRTHDVKHVSLLTGLCGRPCLYLVTAVTDGPVRRMRFAVALLSAAHAFLLDDLHAAAGAALASLGTPTHPHSPTYTCVHARRHIDTHTEAPIPTCIRINTHTHTALVLFALRVICALSATVGPDGRT
jgi:hypothetical protein